MRAAALMLLTALAVTLAGPARAEPAGALSAIFDRCAQAEDRACAERLWSFADVTGDDRLTLAEITRFFRLAAEAMTSRGQPSGGSASPDAPGAPRDDSDKALAVGSAFLTGPIAAQLVIANFDYDDDGVITRQELFLDLDEQAFQRLMVEEADKLPQRAGSLIMRALEAQQQLGGGAE